MFRVFGGGRCITCVPSAIWCYAGIVCVLAFFVYCGHCVVGVLCIMGVVYVLCVAGVVRASRVTCVSVCSLC